MENTRKQYHQEYYRKNGEAIREKTNAYYHANKERYAEYGKERYAADPAKYIAKARKYQDRNKAWYDDLKSRS